MTAESAAWRATITRLPRLRWRTPRTGGPYSRLPLMWKLLLPFLVLEIAIGYLGAALLVNHLSSEARRTINADLSTRYFEAQSLAHDRESSLAEAADLAANLDGMSAAVKHLQPAQVTALGGSVLALKTHLQLLAVTSAAGTSLVDLHRSASSGHPALSKGTPWGQLPFVSTALRATQATVQSGFGAVAGASYLLIAEPICQTRPTCRPVGAVIVGAPVQSIANAALGTSPSHRVSLSLYNGASHLLATSGPARQWSSPPLTGAALTVRSTRNGAAAVYGPFDVLGRRMGTIGIAESTAQAIASARRTGLGLDVLLLVAVLGTLAVGTFVTRGLLRRINRIQRTLRDIGAGELNSRAESDVPDEVGDLADGVNRMAEQLDASYQTLELRVGERTQEVRRLLTQRTEFFAGLSHELRTPLAIILAETELMASSGRRNSGAARASSVVRQSAEQLLALVNDILDVARAETGSLDLHPEPVDLAEAVDDVQQIISGLSSAAGVELTLELPAALPPVTADRRALRQILLNLVDNAVKYTASGGSVTLSARAVGSDVHVIVIDTGVGIANPDDDIFEPFHRASGVRTQHGEPSSGLGLALSRGLARAQGGDITYTSTVGVGSTFTLTLPTYDDVVSAIVVASAP
jgi:signal transduction histidine kinase